MSNKKILVVLSSENKLTLANGKQHRTGNFLGELAEPLLELQKHNIDFDVATPDSKPFFIDPDSLRLMYWFGPLKYSLKKKCQDLVDNHPAFKNLLSLEGLDDTKLSQYSALFIPGGHAPMEDLAKSKDLAKIILYFHKQQKVIASICHGPVAFLCLKQFDNETWLFKDYKITAFSTAEEKIAEKMFLHGPAPFYTDSKLAEQGSKIQNCKIPFMAHVVTDRNLVTGQNPYSTAKFTRALIQKLI